MKDGWITALELERGVKEEREREEEEGGTWRGLKYGS